MHFTKPTKQLWFYILRVKLKHINLMHSMYKMQSKYITKTYWLAKVTWSDRFNNSNRWVSVICIDVHYLPIVWNHSNSASVLFCLYGAVFKQHLVTLIFKHMGNMFIYANCFLYVSILQWLDVVWNNWHRLNTAKWTHWYGDSIHEQCIYLVE